MSRPSRPHLCGSEAKEPWPCCPSADLVGRAYHCAERWPYPARQQSPDTAARPGLRLAVRVVPRVVLPGNLLRLPVLVLLGAGCR